LAQGLDRAQAVLQSLHTGGIGWRQHKVTKAQILEYNQPIATALPAVWEVLRQQIDHLEEQAPWDK
jgi:hypothetical protein